MHVRAAATARLIAGVAHDLGDLRESDAGGRGALQQQRADAHGADAAGAERPRDAAAAVGVLRAVG
eukprot:3353459-Pleurochrysis_carterae.AAC.2